MLNRCRAPQPEISACAGLASANTRHFARQQAQDCCSGAVQVTRAKHYKCRILAEAQASALRNASVSRLESPNRRPDVTEGVSSTVMT